MTDQAAGHARVFERFRIGAFDVAVRSELAEAQRDFAHLYRHCALGPVAAEQLDRQGHIVVEAVRRGAGPWRRRYVVLGDREEIFVGRRTAEVLPYLEWAVNWRIMARRGEYCQVHAASLSRRGAGVVFAAGSGSGKSTLAAGALARGWSYLSDEFALIDAKSRQLTPFPKAMCIKAGSFAAVRRLDLPLFARRHYAKATKGRVGFITPADLPAGAVGAACPMRAVFFPQYLGDTQPQAQPLPRAEAVVRLSELMFNRHHLGADAMAILSDVVRGAACWRLDAGRLEPTLELVESLVDAAVGGIESARASAA